MQKIVELSSMKIKFQSYEVYVEIHNPQQNETLVMLNGIMMSTNSWKPFLKTLTKHFKVVLIDMLDQGQSSKLNDLKYDQSLQVEAIKEVVDQCELKNINLFGISYGGEVAMQFAIAYPSYIKKLLLFNTTSKTSDWLAEIGESWNRAAYNAEAYYATTIPTIYSPKFYQEKKSWMANRKETLLQVFSNKEFTDAMIRLTNSAENHDVVNQLHKITMPTLVVGSECDTITPFAEQEELALLIPNASLMKILDTGHASMYEKPTMFITLILGFILNEQEEVVI